MVEWVENRHGGPPILHAIFEDGVTVVGSILAVLEVTASSAGGVGLEDAGHLAEGVINFDVSNFLFVSFPFLGLEDW